MMILHKLTDWLRTRPEVKTPRTRSSTRLRLEEFEDRVVPSFTTLTYPNASIQITPGFTVTEKVTVSVTPFGEYNSTTGVTTPPPTNTPPPGGTVLLNLNNMQQSATLNSSGQATVTFQVPILAFLTSQSLEISYEGFTDASLNQWLPSTVFEPIYKNWDNVIMSSTITFNQPTPQQGSAPNGNSLIPFGTVAGEKDSIFGGLVTFNYADPGNIETITALGLTLPGSFALNLNAYAGFSTASASSSSS
jgi:hypothetical protein